MPSVLQMRSIVDAGELLPDSLMLEVLNQRLAAGQAAGESGVLLDGFPRTRAQVTLKPSDPTSFASATPCCIILVFLTSCHAYSILIHTGLSLQAEALVQTADVQLAVNLHVREEVRRQLQNDCSDP